MKATVYHGTRDLRLENVPDPSIVDPGDAIVRITRAAICGSDLGFYRGVTKLQPGARTDHEFSDGTCEFCRANLQTSSVYLGFFGGENGGQAEFVRVPYADGTLVKIPEAIAGDPDKLDASVTLCDVMGTGHYGVVAAQTTPGSTVVVVGDGAVGLCAVLSAAREVQAERIVAVGHNRKRLEIAKHFGATDTFDSHDANVQEQIAELTGGGAPHVVEAVGNQDSLDLAAGVARPGGTVSLVGVPHNHISLRGGPAPVRAYLPQLMASLEGGRIDPSRVLDLAIPLASVADGYAAMDERRAIKVPLAVA